MSADRDRRALLVAALIGGLVTATVVAVARGWLDVVEVHGDSMQPTLRDGDLLIVEQVTFRMRAPRAGDLVLATDPRQPSRELVKRVAVVRDGYLTLLGDNSSASTDSLTFGDVPSSSVTWRVLARYAPGRSALATARA